MSEQAQPDEALTGADLEETRGDLRDLLESLADDGHEEPGEDETG